MKASLRISSTEMQKSTFVYSKFLPHLIKLSFLPFSTKILISPIYTHTIRKISWICIVLAKSLLANGRALIIICCALISGTQTQYMQLLTRLF